MNAAMLFFLRYHGFHDKFTVADICSSFSAPDHPIPVVEQLLLCHVSSALHLFEDSIGGFVFNGTTSAPFLLLPEMRPALLIWLQAAPILGARKSLLEYLDTSPEIY
jgi:hypothetical protein